MSPVKARMIGDGMEESNILVTFHPNEKERAKVEIRELLKEVNHPAQSIVPVSVEGVYAVRIFEDGKEAISKLKSLCMSRPSKFRFTFHWVPIDQWVPARLDKMQETARELGKGIGRSERWKMHLHKRHSPEHAEELIIRLTDPIDRGVVDLKHPDKIVVVEIIGEMAGMSLAKVDEILDVHEIAQRMEIEIEM
ncbi:MAG: hypothetical protein A4E32_01605 [Methanomassiliicoccales archaeon PtaU1.Bin124]|nr:MAG: hypothetical protein A4E32_01605 [Methanomassiliicoccales archaeon PtaU1.Bin124]